MIAAPLAPSSTRPSTSIQPVMPQSTISGRANTPSTKVATRSAPSYQASDQMPAAVSARPGSSVAHGDQPLSSDGDEDQRSAGRGEGDVPRGRLAELR